ncbi:hypothetical protein RA210_U10440 [Rubrivivax sp. A210]|uniref:hypothetical protein n=1 Tax=Rubrivivax sp. A210 TaxID=2772301 RepID=UPI001917CD00|nr:hypothetical protein [Rubrivivax sp. A210]CAD5366667.1 hypothetical protein RA210_U10440 [Rubrivivax sp. A210]
MDPVEIVQPGPDATEAEWVAYRMAYSRVAMEARRRQQLVLHAELVEKVQPEHAARALAAFSIVLAAAGIDPWEASAAQFKLETWDDRGFPEELELTARESDAALAWRQAVEAARVEVCDQPPFVSAAAFDQVDLLDQPPVEHFVGTFSLHDAARALGISASIAS